MKKTLQLFSDEYLEYCKMLTPEQIAVYLEDFKYVAFQSSKQKSKLISLKVPEELLRSFKFQCEKNGAHYQTVIKDLMREWLITQ